MGAKIPKGILFYGPPGTGKTLLAKAVAGGNQLYLYMHLGLDLSKNMLVLEPKEGFVTLFERAKKEAPSIIFIDEIDAIGAKEI